MEEDCSLLPYVPSSLPDVSGRMDLGDKAEDILTEDSLAVALWQEVQSERRHRKARVSLAR